MFILLIFILLPLTDLLFWWWADRRLRPLRRHRLWRSLLAALCATEFLFFASLILGRLAHLPFNPGPAIAYVYLWHLFALPLALLLMLGDGVLSLASTLLTRLRPTPSRPVIFPPAPALAPTQPTPGSERSDDPDSSAPSIRNPQSPIRNPYPSRRQLLRASAAAIPPIALAYTLGVSAYEQGKFRINRFTLAYPNLPPDLDGFTIANVSDVHIGHFIYGKILEDISHATNALNPDVITVTGDLIDHSLADLPAGIELLKSFRPRRGLYVCEGNHDLFEGRPGFERPLLNAGLPLLLNTSDTIKVGATKLQFLGTRWGVPTDPNRRVHATDFNTAATLDLLDPTAFPILLAHHPHAFHTAADRRVPLTLAGHTHGGQVMLTKNLGPGPLMYDFWSGLYENPNGSKLIVSNGVGNWFPLRINAPAEILHITLKRAQP